MEQQWFFNLLEKAKEEIKRLRAENTLMATRLEMFDNMILLFNGQKAQQGRGMSPDIVYDIEKVIVEFNVTEDHKKNDRQFTQADTSTNAFMEGSLGRRDFEPVNSSDKK